MCSRVLAAFALAALPSSLPAQARDIPSCPVPSGAVAASLDRGAPEAVLKALRAKFGEIARPGEDFNVTDYIEKPGLSFRRMIFMWGRDRRWVVAMELGGRGYSNPVAAFDLSANGRTATLAKVSAAQPETVCGTAAALIGGPPR